MPHIMELFGKTRIVVKDGKVVEVGEPVADWCPVFSKVSNVSRLTSREAKKNMEYRIRELGMFTPERKLDQGVFVNFGASEIMMTALSRGLIDSTVTVCDGAGTVITDNPALVQGMGALMSGLIETEPIAQIIAGIESRGGIVLDKQNARIDQAGGLLRACELGYKNIAVSVVSPAEAGKLRLIEKEKNIDLILIGCSSHRYPIQGSTRAYCENGYYNELRFKYGAPPGTSSPPGRDFCSHVRIDTEGQRIDH